MWQRQYNFDKILGIFVLVPCLGGLCYLLGSGLVTSAIETVYGGMDTTTTVLGVITWIQEEIEAHQRIFGTIAWILGGILSTVKLVARKLRRS